MGSTLSDEKPFSLEKPMCATCLNWDGELIIDLSILPPPLPPSLLLRLSTEPEDLLDDLAVGGWRRCPQPVSLSVTRAHPVLAISPYFCRLLIFLYSSPASPSSAKAKAITYSSPSRVCKKVRSWLYDRGSYSSCSQTTPPPFCVVGGQSVLSGRLSIAPMSHF